VIIVCPFVSLGNRWFQDTRFIEERLATKQRRLSSGRIKDRQMTSNNLAPEVEAVVNILSSNMRDVHRSAPRIGLHLHDGAFKYICA
jgi:hypothetical protein